MAQFPPSLIRPASWWSSPATWNFLPMVVSPGPKKHWRLETLRTLHDHLSCKHLLHLGKASDLSLPFNQAKNSSQASTWFIFCGKKRCIRSSNSSTSSWSLIYSHGRWHFSRIFCLAHFGRLYLPNTFPPKKKKQQQQQLPPLEPRLYDQNPCLHSSGWQSLHCTTLEPPKPPTPSKIQRVPTLEESTEPPHCPPQQQNPPPKKRLAGCHSEHGIGRVFYPLDSHGLLPKTCPETANPSPNKIPSRGTRTHIPPKRVSAGKSLTQKYLEKGICDRSQEATLIRAKTPNSFRKQNIRSPKTAPVCRPSSFGLTKQQQAVSSSNPSYRIPTRCCQVFLSSFAGFGWNSCHLFCLSGVSWKIIYITIWTWYFIHLSTQGFLSAAWWEA